MPRANPEHFNRSLVAAEVLGTACPFEPVFCRTESAFSGNAEPVVGRLFTHIAAHHTDGEAAAGVLTFEVNVDD